MKGNVDPIKLYELTTLIDIDQGLLDNFAEALAAFRAENWERAAMLFKTLHDQFELDGPTEFYFRTSENYVRNGPDSSWNGRALRLAKESFA